MLPLTPWEVGLIWVGKFVLVLFIVGIFLKKHFYLVEPRENSMKSQGRENSWPNPNLPDKKVRDVLFYEVYLHRGSKKLPKDKQKKKSGVRRTWLAHASSTEDRQLHFCTLGHAGRNAVVANSLNYQKWSRRTVPSSCIQLHRVIVTSMQSLGKNTTRMALQGARLSPSPARPPPFFLLFR